MNNDFAFYDTGVDNFSALFVKTVFAKYSSIPFKVWVTLYTCAGTREVMPQVLCHILIKAHSLKVSEDL